MYQSSLSAAAPPRTHQQRMDALAKGNAIRSDRKRLKRDLKAGRITVRELIDHPSFSTAKVFDVLVAVPRIGRVKANTMMQTGRMSPAKTCAGLTERQRTELATQLDLRGIR